MRAPHHGWRAIVRLALGGAMIAGVAMAAQQAPASADPAEIKAALDRGVELRGKQNPIRAKPFLLRAIEGAERLNDRPMLQNALFSLAQVNSDLNNLPAALDLAQRAYDTLPDPKGAARVRYSQLRGRVYQELHDREASLAAYKEGIEVANTLGNDVLLGGLENEIGLLYYRFDRNIPLALEHYDRAIELFTKAGDYRGVGVVMNNSGNIFREPGTYPEAERRYRLGLAAMTRAGVNGDPMLTKNMGVVFRETGRRTEAEEWLKRSVFLADTLGNGRIEWQGRMELGTFYSTSDPARAADYYEQTLKVLEARNTNVLLEGFRAGALSGSVTIYDDPYDLYTDFLLNAGRAGDAFFVAERARARAFLDTLSLARETIAAALPAAFVSEERALLEEISKNQGALRAETVDSTRRASIQAAIVSDEDKLTQIRVRLATEHPSLAQARYPHLTSVEDVQKNLLQPDEVLLEYFVGAKSGTLWIITPSRLEIKRLPPRDEIQKAVRPYLEGLANPESHLTGPATALMAMLLPGLDEVVSDRSHLIVVPQGILTYLPFETLVTRRGHFLVEDRPVSYAPSSSSLAFLRGRKVSGTDVLAVGNPVMRDDGTDTERGQSVSRVGYLKPLAYSGPEVRAVADVFGARARVFEQRDATEAVLESAEASHAGIIHIATHGLIDEELPDRSGLALTAAMPQSDGILQMREVYKLHLNAALVTLSACQTALGKEVTGEGMIGLSRAFFYAGANAVLASLWNVNDASTPQLMTPFYEALGTGQSIDQALRASKVAMLEGGGHLAHPYYWAAFVVSGNASAPVGITPQNRSKTWLIGLVAAVALAGGAVAWRRVR